MPASSVLCLSPVEARVLGVLAEKQRTVPDSYPMTLNALLAGCNQKTSRDPVMEVTEAQAQEALDSLRVMNLAIETSGDGSCATSTTSSECCKYRLNPQPCWRSSFCAGLRPPENCVSTATGCTSSPIFPRWRASSRSLRNGQRESGSRARAPARCPGEPLDASALRRAGTGIDAASAPAPYRSDERASSPPSNPGWKRWRLEWLNCRH